MSTALVFGVFDGLHAGHNFLFNTARKYGDKLKVVLTPDEVVFLLKGHAPKFNFEERLKHLKSVDGIDEIIKGDLTLSSWAILDRVKPDVIVLGYDQQTLQEDLLSHIQEKGLNIKIYIAAPFEPEKYHSSLLNI
mgnify:CR=1 FL=1